MSNLSCGIVFICFCACFNIAHWLQIIGIVRFDLIARWIACLLIIWIGQTGSSSLSLSLSLSFFWVGVKRENFFHYVEYFHGIGSINFTWILVALSFFLSLLNFLSFLFLKFHFSFTKPGKKILFIFNCNSKCNNYCKRYELNFGFIFKKNKIKHLICIQRIVIEKWIADIWCLGFL